MISRREFYRAALPPGVLVCSLFCIYFVTLAPSLTWANSGSDGGDLISAAATGGVPHPSGYPLYLILAGLFQRLPVGSLAFRTNLMSAVCSLLAAGLLFALLEKQLRSSTPALLAALAYGLSPLVWSQAVITEVYALQALLTVAILSALLSPVRKPSLFMGQGLLFGLALGNHLTTLFLAPLLIFLRPPAMDGARPEPLFSRQSAKVIGLRFAGVFLGLLIYGILPLRASAGPPVNWGNPVTLDNFWWLVSAQIYREYAFSLSAPEILERFQGWAGFLLHQFTFIGLGLGFYGVTGKLPAWLRASTIWLFVSFSLFAIFYVYPDSYVYILPANLALSVWIGVALQDLSAIATKQGYRWSQLLPIVLFVGLLVRSLSLLPELDASRDQRAETFGKKLMTSAPQDALIFTDTDKETFSLWYFHFALGQRPDLAIIASSLLPFNWYQETLETTYPDLNMPDLFPWPETVASANPTRPACFVEYTEQTEMECFFH